MKGVQVLIFLGAISGIFCIKCYQCNSMTNAKCGEPFSESPTMVVDCDEETQSFQPAIKSTFCRKISQTDVHEIIRLQWNLKKLSAILVYGQTRTIRSCGFLVGKTRRTRCEFNSFVKASESYYCECDKDLCNRGIVAKLSMLLMIALMISTRLFL